MPRETRKKYQTIDQDINALINATGLVIDDIERGEPKTYLMGYLYPDNFEDLIKSAEFDSKLNFACNDLENSITRYQNLSETIRLCGESLINLAEVLDARDQFVQDDLGVLREYASKLPSGKGRMFHEEEYPDKIQYARKNKDW